MDGVDVGSVKTEEINTAHFSTPVLVSAGGVIQTCQNSTACMAFIFA